MIAKIKRQECLEKYSKFPQIFNEDEFYYPKLIREYVLVLPIVSVDKYSSKLSQQFTLLVDYLGLDSLIFLGDYKTAWLRQDNDFKPAKKALEYLKMQGIGVRFNGGIEVSAEDLPVFSRHLFWLTRCNASLPSFHFLNNKQEILGNICKYGSVHVQTLSKRTDNKLQTVISKTEFSLLKGRCYEPFSKSGGIKGREIIV
jgi:hypothetical protein